MKMSDVWPSGFSGVNFTYGKFQQVTSELGETVNDGDVDCLCGLVFSNEEPAKAMMHAINNHDRLTEENAKLQEVLERLVNPDNCKKDIIHIIGNAESLLNQLKDQNNDK